MPLLFQVYIVLIESAKNSQLYAPFCSKTNIPTRYHTKRIANPFYTGFLLNKRLLLSTRTGKTSAHLVNGGLLYEARGVCRQQAVGGHDVDLIRPTLLQDLCRRDKVLHVVNDVILRGKGVQNVVLRATAHPLIGPLFAFASGILV